MPASSVLHVTGTCLIWLPVQSRGPSTQCLAYSRNPLSTCWMNKWTGNVIKTHENIHHISFTTALWFRSSLIAFGLGTRCLAGLTNSPALWPEGQILPRGNAAWNSQSSQDVLGQYTVFFPLWTLCLVSHLSLNAKRPIDTNMLLFPWQERT